MALPNSRADLVEYCLRECGKPLVKVNVSPDQIDDAIDEAIQYFQEYHNEGQERVYLAHQLSQLEIDQNKIVLPENVFAVLSVLNTSLYGANFNFMTPQFELMRNITFDAARAGNVSDYVVTRQYLADIEAMLSPVPGFSYRQTTGTLEIFDNLSRVFKAGQFIVCEAYVTINPTVYTRFWRNRTLRKLAAGLVMQYYGTNLTKYQSIQLPSGITVDGEQLRNEGIRRVQEARAEIDENGYPLGIITR